MVSEELTNWLRVGKQKSAVITSLYKPLTSVEVCTRVRKSNPSIFPQDVSAWFTRFCEKNLLYCLNPEDKTGRLYFVTDLGRKIVEESFGIVISPLRTDVIWEQYVTIVRAKRRRAVLLEIAEMEFAGHKEIIAMRIKQRLRKKHPVCLNAAIRAVKDLKKLCLIRQVAETKKRGLSIYGLTSEGKLIAEELLR